MGPETAKWDTKCGDMKNIPNQDALPVEQNDGNAPPQDRSIGVVAHPDTEVLNRLVGVWDHVVHCISVCHNQSKTRHGLLGEIALSRADMRPGERTVSFSKGSTSNSEE